MSANTLSPESTRRGHNYTLAILLSCRHCYAEDTPVFWGINSFIIGPGLQGIKACQNIVGDDNARLIEHLVDYTSNQHVFRYLGAIKAFSVRFSGCKIFDLDVEIRPLDLDKNNNRLRQALEFARGFIKIHPSLTKIVRRREDLRQSVHLRFVTQD